jgi:hypothetical protein
VTEQESASDLTGWRSGLFAHLRSGQVSRVVYGSIIGLALVLTLQAHANPPMVVVGSLVATGLAVGLAELYSEEVGARVRSGVGGHAEPLRVVVTDTVAVAFGIAFPSVFFVAAQLGLVEVATAYHLAKWTGLGLIAAYGYLAARLSGSRPAGALLQAGGVAVIAAALIVVKALLH